MQNDLQTEQKHIAVGPCRKRLIRAVVCAASAETALKMTAWAWADILSITNEVRQKLK